MQRSAADLFRTIEGQVVRSQSLMGDAEPFSLQQVALTVRRQVRERVAWVFPAYPF